MKEVESKDLKVTIGALDNSNAKGVIYSPSSLKTKIAPPSADFDGDTFSGSDEYTSVIAFENLKKLRGAVDYYDQLTIFREVAAFNQSKFNSLSKRRKKIYMSQVGRYYHELTGELIHKSRRNSPHIQLTPMHMLKESIGKPMTNFLNAWADSLVK